MTHRFDRPWSLNEDLLLLLGLWGGGTYSQIAAALHKSRGAVAGRISRLRGYRWRRARAPTKKGE